MLPFALLALATQTDAPGQQPAPELPHDFRTTVFINDLPKEVPVPMREAAWGFLTRRWSMTFLSVNEARAMLHFIDKMCLDIEQAVPAWKIDDHFVLELQNFQNYCYSMIFSSVLRETEGDVVNERLSLIRQEMANRGQAPGGNKKGKGLWPWNW